MVLKLLEDTAMDMDMDMGMGMDMAIMKMNQQVFGLVLPENNL